MEKGIAERVLENPDIVRKMLKAIGEDDPGALTPAYTDTQPQEQYIIQYDKTIRRETGEFIVNTFDAEDGTMYVTAFADDNLHFQTQKLLQLTAESVHTLLNDTRKYANMHFLMLSEGVLEHFCMREPSKGIQVWNIGLERAVYTAFDSPDIGEMLEVINGKAPTVFTELGKAAIDIALERWKERWSQI